MKRKSWFFSLYLLIMIFSENLLYSVFILMGRYVESGYLQRVFIPLALISFFVFVMDSLKHRINRGRKKSMIIMIVVLILYVFTSFLYISMPEGYFSILLRYGSICLASGIAGGHFAIERDKSSFEYMLPFFILFIGLIMGTFGYGMARTGVIVDRYDDAGMSYQRISYVMAELFSYSAYFVLFSDLKGTVFYKVMRFPIAIMMIYTAIVCPMSGGRGAFLLLVFMALFFLLLYLRKNRKKIVGVSIFIASLAGMFLYFASRAKVWNSIGFMRISERFTEDEGREVLFSKAWNSIYEHNYLGSGLGSVWNEVGFYTHNFFLDLLVEVGIIGLIVAIIAITYSVKKLYIARTESSINLFVLIILLDSVIHLMTSAYWLSYYPLWMAFAYSLTINSTKRKRYVCR